MALDHALRTRHEPEFCLTVLAALRELRDARRAMLRAKSKLAMPLSQVQRASFERAHDLAARRVTKARFDLDTALDASEDA